MRTLQLISLLLLLVQGLALHHVASSSHVIDDSGAAWDEAAVAADSHHSDEAHVCADVAVPGELDVDCAVWLGVHQASLSPRPVVWHAWAVVGWPVDVRTARGAHVPQAVLAAAPKGSPPAV